MWMFPVPFCEENPREVEEHLFFEPPPRGLPRIEKRCLDRNCEGCFLGYPDFPRGRWKELRDTLQGDSWTSLKLDPAFFCLRDCSGHLIGRISIFVDDMLQATDNSHQAESHISRLLSKYDIKDVKWTDDDGGVFYCGERVRSAPDDLKPSGSGLATRPDGVRESLLRTGRYVSSSSPTRGRSVHAR